MKPLLAFAALAACFFAVPAHAAPVLGQPAPDFSVTDTAGQTVKLSDLKGKNVVLEWTNHECPFVVKHYETNNMQKLQKKWTDQGAVWIAVVSSAEGKQGHLAPEAANKLKETQGAAYTHKILDSTGELGQLYGAKTTPHMFVINAEGVLAYKGAIDDNPSPRASSVEGAVNHVDAALTDLVAGKAVTMAETESYGCSIKYAN